MRDRTNFQQSTASENCGGKRDQKSLFDREPVTSQDAITLENNEKFWPQVDREKRFTRASGGGDDPRAQLSPVQVSTARDRFEILRAIEGQ